MEMTRELIEKVDRGDSLTNKELYCALKFYEELTHNLSLLRPEYHLAWKDALNKWQRLQSFYDSRTEVKWGDEPKALPGEGFGKSSLI